MAEVEEEEVAAEVLLVLLRWEEGARWAPLLLAVQPRKVSAPPDPCFTQ
jgi:hypothetical protein